MAKVGRRGYPSDVTDEEWWFLLPCLLLCREDSEHREHDLREVLNRSAVRGQDGLPVALGDKGASRGAAGTGRWRDCL